MEEQKKTERQPTAHEIWVGMLTQKLETALRPALTRKNYGYHAVGEALQRRADRAVGIATSYADTRLRVVVDKMIEMIKAYEAENAANQAAVKATWLFQFRKRRRLELEAWSITTAIETYKQAIQITINTLPPPPAPVEEKEEAKVVPLNQN